MKIKHLLIAFLLITGYAFSQADTIPLVTAKDINYIPDSSSFGWPASPLNGKLVHVRGEVMVRTRVDPFVAMDRRPILTYTKALSSFVQTYDSAWSGLNIYQADSSFAGTLFDIVDTASTYEFTGVVTTYGQLTELMLTTVPQPIPIGIISQQAKRPEPLVLTFDSLYDAQGAFIYPMRKYQGMYVIMTADESHPLITSDLITGSGSTAGGFKVNDLSGHKIQMYANSNYFKTASTYPRLRTDGYTPPPNGSYIPYIKGILEGYNSATDGWIWEIVCIYPEDLGVPQLSPPAITNVRRDLGVVAPGTPVTVTCTVKGLAGGIVKNVWLFKRVNNVLDSLEMTKGTGADTSTFTCTIPGVTGDSSYVDYYVRATDYNDLSSTSPGNAATSRYSYFVLNKPLTIQHVRYSPMGSGYSSYNGYHVTVTGVVISDTSDIPGNYGTNPSRVYIQNGETPWSGIQLGTNGPNITKVKALIRGDEVTVEGVVLIGSYGTRVDSLSLVQVNSTGNTLPVPHVMKTSEVGTFTLGNLSPEPWNGTLVKYVNVTIDSANADGTSNFGESFGKDVDLGTHTRLIWSDGHTFLNAGPSAVSVHKGDHFDAITGVLGYTHSNYKLCPRKNDDIVGFTDVKTENQVMPTQYALSQNYPNPFNPSTVISYSIPKSGLVNIKVFNLLGQEVRTLVNQNQNAGTFQVTFNANSLTSGVYFYSLTVDNFTQVKKMMLLK
jgi:hypothetical protein